MKFYAIKKGRKNDQIVETWKECSDLVSGFSGAIYKSFSTRQEAEEFLGVEVSKPKPVKMENSKMCIFYTDGSLSKGKAGFAIYNQKSSEVVYGPLEDGTTVPQAEFHAILEACRIFRNLYRLDDSLTARILTDSEYCFKTITIWSKSWIQKYGLDPDEWKTSKGEKVANLDYLLPILRISQKYPITFDHVSAHSGIEGNEIVDRYAKRGRDTNEVMIQKL